MCKIRMGRRISVLKCWRVEKEGGGGGVGKRNKGELVSCSVVPIVVSLEKTE